MSNPIITNTCGQINVSFPFSSTQTYDRTMSTKQIDHAKHAPLHRAMHRLEQLVGLNDVKDFILETYAWMYIGQCRREFGLKAEQQTLHMVFSGNPGTGKTTIARIIGELFQDMGILSKGHVIEVERSDLVGEYIGHTARKTREMINKALGGILFIDEAYSLARGGDKDFGKEAIDCLVKMMEDHRKEFILILAGYPQEMKTFLSSNPGLPSRFPVQLHFSDYDVSELIKIGEVMVNEQEYHLSSSAKRRLTSLIRSEKETAGIHFSNARFVRNVIEKAIREHAVRLLQMRATTKSDLMTLEARDFFHSERESRIADNRREGTYATAFNGERRFS